MKRESLAFLISGTFFGLLIGWIIGAQQAPPSAAAPAATAAPAQGAAPGAAPAPTLDVARVTELEQQARANPTNAAVRVELANLYFDAERYDRALPMYEEAFKLDPKNVSVSTDLAVAYYYSNQTDKALKQFDASLAIDPKHLKTLLNQGIVRAFGKQDLAGATESWQKVVDIAPESEEGKRAKQGLDGLRSAHQDAAAGTASAPAGTAPAPAAR